MKIFNYNNEWFSISPSNLTETPFREPTAIPIGEELKTTPIYTYNSWNDFLNSTHINPILSPSIPQTPIWITPTGEIFFATIDPLISAATVVNILNGQEFAPRPDYYYYLTLMTQYTYVSFAFHSPIYTNAQKEVFDLWSIINNSNSTEMTILPQ